MKSRDITLDPGATAPLTANYELLNAFGTPEGTIREVGQGAPLPPAPLRWSWRLRRVFERPDPRAAT